VVVLAIPYIGHVTLFLHEPMGFAIVVILFLALLILPELFMKHDDEDVEEPIVADEQETQDTGIISG
jgi:ABC-type transport system involved in cytochrome bd biosynthesis fused ATPase/permease subunit